MAKKTEKATNHKLVYYLKRDMTVKKVFSFPITCTNQRWRKKTAKSAKRSTSQPHSEFRRQKFSFNLSDSIEMNYFLVPCGADYNIADHYGTLNLGDFTLDSSISSVPQSMPTSPHTTDSSFEANWQEHQGYNNTWYHNDSNQGYAPNDGQLAFGNQGYSATQYGGIQENLQEHQGYNIGYQNYSNQGHAPNAENQGYSNSADSSFEENVAQDEMKAVVSKEGYLIFHLRKGIVLYIAPNHAIKMDNPTKEISLTLSGCGTQASLIHPFGRVFQYNSRIEVHALDAFSSSSDHEGIEKSAKIWPRGISFTSNSCALVYLVDSAGARSTSDYFKNLYSEDITQSLFVRSNDLYKERSTRCPIQTCTEILENVQFYRTDKADCWIVDEALIIEQTFDGFVSVERKLGQELFTMKTSPSNGKARLQSSFLYVTASLGEDSHLFVKSNDRRIHHSRKAFVVRNAGHSAGFDEFGGLRIW